MAHELSAVARGGLLTSFVLTNSVAPIGKRLSLLMVEAIELGSPETAFMRPGDTVRLEMLDLSGTRLSERSSRL